MGRKPAQSAPVRTADASGLDGPDPASQRHRHCPRRAPTPRGPEPSSRATRLTRPWCPFPGGARAPSMSCDGARRAKAGPIRPRPGAALHGGQRPSRASWADGGVLIGRRSLGPMHGLRPRCWLGLRRAVPTRGKLGTRQGGPAAGRPRAGCLAKRDSSMKNCLCGSLAAALRRGLRHQIRPAPARPPPGPREEREIR